MSHLAGKSRLAYRGFPGFPLRFGAFFVFLRLPHPWSRARCVRRRRPPRHGWRRRGGCAPLRATQVAPTPMLPLSNARALCPRGGKPATSPRLFPASPARPPRISRFFQIWPDISFADSDTVAFQRKYMHIFLFEFPFFHPSPLA